MTDGVKKTEVATLGGGCFWCLHAAFNRINGISGVVSGYAGGSVENPGYQQVCSGTTGHAEVVQLAFDPQVISYTEILEVFFALHDPTTLNRQGADVGTQYRSVVFYHDELQKKAAEAVVSSLEAGTLFTDPVVTQLEPLDAFFPAEEYHQDYYEHNPDQPYCQVVIHPKLAKLRKNFTTRLK